MDESKTPQDYREFIIKDIVFLEGVTHGLEGRQPAAAKAIRNRLENIKKNLKNLMLSINPEDGDGK